MEAELPADFPERIQRLRRRRGLSQKRLAELLGVSFMSVSRWEHGRARPSLLAWRQILHGEAEGFAPLAGAESNRRLISSLAGAPDRGSQQPPTNLPGALISFVGRARDLAELPRLLETARLITLTGAGGSGKTRLALEVGYRVSRIGYRAAAGGGYRVSGIGSRADDRAGLLDRSPVASSGSAASGSAPSAARGSPLTLDRSPREGERREPSSDTRHPIPDTRPPFPDGVWLVELGALRDPNLVPLAVAAVLKVREQRDISPLETLCTALESRALLLLLDNCEHLLPACAHLVERLLYLCPQIRILATSRELLHVAGEVVWPVLPLSLPAGLGARVSGLGRGVAPEPGLDSPALTRSGEVDYVTSAEALDVRTPATRSDTRYPIPVTASEAVQLFVERARLRRPSFALDDLNAEVVVQVCRRLDGLPLALELAAARVRHLPLEEIAARLDDRFRLLVNDNQTAPARQQTLRATLDWSYDLLAPEEQRLFAWLSVFAGSFSLEATEGIGYRVSGVEWEEADGSGPVAGGGWRDAESGRGEPLGGSAASPARGSPRTPSSASGSSANGSAAFSARGFPLTPSLSPSRGEGKPPSSETRDPIPDTLDVLTSLVDKSLVVLEEGAGDTRFRLLETLRVYGGERLLASGEAETVYRRRAQYYLSLATEAEANLLGPDQRLWLDRLEREHDNFRVTPQWTIDRQEVALGLRVAGPLASFWQMRGLLGEGRQWLGRLLELPARVPSSVRASALVRAGMLAEQQGAYDEGVTYVEQGLELSRETEDDALTGSALAHLGSLLWRRSDFDRSTACFEESLAIARRLDRPSLIARCLNSLGVLATDQGQLETAHECFSEALAVARAVGDATAISVRLNNLAMVAIRREDLSGARSYAEEGLALGRQGGNTGMLSVHLRRLAETLLRQGDLELAECHAVEALGVARSINNQFEVAEALDHCARVALAQMDLAAATSYAREGLSIAHTLRTPRQIWMAIERLGSIARQAGAWPQAIRLFAVAEVQRATTGEVSAAGAVQKIESYLLEIAAEHGDEPVSAAWATARAMGQDEAVSYALAADGPPVRAEPGGEPADPSAPSLPPGSHSPFPDHLTARELSVLRQLAAGRSNAEIAGDLVLSLRTVERHISNIYAKLSIHGSRSARASAAAHWHTHIGRRS